MDAGSAVGWRKGQSMSLFDEDLFLKGLEQRKATLGADYVQRNLDGADEFNRPFQEAMTAWCWGFGWGDGVIDAKTRSMMNLAMIGALGKMAEWELHCRGALRNGVSREEIRAIIHVVAIYCGRTAGTGNASASRARCWKKPGNSESGIPLRSWFILVLRAPVRQG